VQRVQNGSGINFKDTKKANTLVRICINYFSVCLRAFSVELCVTINYFSRTYTEDHREGTEIHRGIKLVGFVFELNLLKLLVGFNDLLLQVFLVFHNLLHNLFIAGGNYLRGENSCIL